MDRRNWERRIADIALCETNRKLESQRLELYQANQWADQAQREKNWLFGDLDMRNRLSREDRAKDCQEIEELRRICCEEADATQRESFYRDSAFGSESGLAGQGEFPE